MRSANIDVSKNTISEFGLWNSRGKFHHWNSDSDGIYLEYDVSNSSISKNTVTSTTYGDFGIRVTKDTSRNQIANNLITGQYTQLPFLVEGENTCINNQ